MIEGVDYYIRVVPFPSWSVGGMVMPNDDGTFSVYLNARLSLERQRQALKHELEHISNGDFYNDRPIESIEKI